MNQKPTWLVPAILVLIGVFCVVAVILIIVVSVKHNRRKLAEFQASVEAMGLSFMPKGDKAFARAWSIIKPLPKGGSVTNVVFGTLASGLTLTAFKHLYAVSTGKSTHIVYHAVAAVDTPAWPRIEVKRRGAMMKWVRGVFKREKRDPAAPPPTGSENDRAKFDQDWIVGAEDPVFADALLTERVRLAMSLHEKVVAWWFVGGKMAVLRSDAQTPETLAESIAQIEAVWSALPAEILQRDAITDETNGA